STSNIVTTMTAKAAHNHHVPIDSTARSAHKNEKGPVPEGHRPLRAVAARTLPLGKVSLATDSIVAPGTGRRSGDRSAVMTMPRRKSYSP
ncbi:MAG: hypothetical protein ACYC5W_05560, partial [Thauera sp.]